MIWSTGERSRDLSDDRRGTNACSGRTKAAETLSGTKPNGSGWPQLFENGGYLQAAG